MPSGKVAHMELMYVCSRAMKEIGGPDHHGISSTWLAYTCAGGTETMAHSL